jgi:UDP-2,3-diacylglucosamine pyrophosphatase LpxH
MSTHYRAIWMSDLHLGTRGSNARGVLEFIRDNESDTLYLVGDIIDLWNLRKDHFWPQPHNTVIQKLLRKARKGTQVIYIPGNHDEFTANFFGEYGSITVKKHHVHTTADGQRLVVMHGHEFDVVTMNARWLALLGDLGYRLLLSLNRPLNYIRSHFGLGYWSLSAYVKNRVKSAVSFIGQFEDAVVKFAEMHDAHGIICGHIHTPAIKQIRNVDYYNCGDWVESNTALVEHQDGRIELVKWEESLEGEIEEEEEHQAEAGDLPHDIPLPS